MKNDTHKLSKSQVVENMPLVCSNELAAVEFFEKQRWGNTPACVKCGSVEVYKMKDAKTGERNKRFLWRCRDCKEQYTVRIGTVYEESRIELRHWAYAFWRACTSKKGVSALEIKRVCQISYKSALFLMNRIRFAMAPDPQRPKLTGTSKLTKCTLVRAGSDIRAPVARATERIRCLCFARFNAVAIFVVES
jgi:transposase-like protein